MSSLKDLYKDVEAHVSEITNPKPYEQWVRENTKINSVPFTTARFPFQKKILNDLHPNMDVIKCSQIGLSEIQIRKVLAMAYRNANRTIIFSLPSEDMRDRLMTTRVKPILTQNPIFSEEMTKDTARSVGVTQIKNSFVLWVPATEKSATSQPADAVFNDEVDLSNQKILSLFNSRMQASDWRLNQRFSTPTYVGYGIDKSFKLSDQHLYMYKCPHCNYYQHPEFTPEFLVFPRYPFNISNDLSDLESDWVDKYKLNFSEAHIVCKKCRKPADLGNSELREWVCQFPSRLHHRGYRVTPLSTQSLTPKYIFEQLITYKKDNFVRGWYNTVLGLPYEGGAERLNEAELNALFVGSTQLESYDPNFEYFIGYDVGTVCHIVLCKSHPDYNNETKFIYWEVVKSDALQKRIEYFVKTYNIVAGNGDKYPEQKLAKDIKEATNNIVLPTRYENNKSPDILEYKMDELDNLDHCTLQRTLHFDELVADIRAGAVSISGYGNYKESIVEHFRDMVRIDKPESIPIWEKLTGVDHWFHAAGYAYRAKKRHYFDYTSKPTKSTLIFGGLGFSLYNVENSLFGGKKNR